MFLSGTHAARPAASAVGKGSLYSCSDHDLIYQSDGSSWSTWATLGAVASSHAAVWLTDASTQTIGTSSFTTVEFDTETTDTDGFHSGTGGILIPSAVNGRTMVFGANVGIEANATGARQAKIVKNLAGAPVVLAYGTELGSASISYRDTLTTPAIVVATGDTINVQVWQNSGADRVTVNADGLPSLWGYTVD
jgi:hypothetical protein